MPEAHPAKVKIPITLTTHIGDDRKRDLFAINEFADDFRRCMTNGDHAISRGTKSLIISGHLTEVGDTRHSCQVAQKKQ